MVNLTLHKKKVAQRKKEHHIYTKTEYQKNMRQRHFNQNILRSNNQFFGIALGAVKSSNVLCE
jgi:hypothetical protein